MDAPVHAIVDCGLDDALALGVLVGLKIPLEQVVATEGSTDLATTASATRRLMLTLGSPVPVRLGSGEGLIGPYPGGRDPFHGHDAFGGRTSLLEPAAVPTESLRPLHGRVFCTGALTVVARGISQSEPVSGVTWMGGAVAAGGNMTAAAEFNAWMDPLATDQVFTSGIPVRMIPLDVTMRFRWSTRELDTIRQASRSGSVLARAIDFVHDRDGVFVPHDAVAAIALAVPELFTWRSRQARCEWEGAIATGATVIDRRPHSEAGPVLVAEDVDVFEVSARIVAAIGQLP